MVAWIIYFSEAANYNKKYIEFHIEEGAKLGIDVKLILVEELEFGVSDNKWFLRYQDQEIPKPDFVIIRAIYPLLSRQLEYMKIPVFNNSFVSEICNDKARTYQYLAKTGIRMVNSCFYKNQLIPQVHTKMNGPTVIKAVEGHGGSQVFLMNPSKKQLHKNDSETEDSAKEDNSKEDNSKEGTTIEGTAKEDVVIDNSAKGAFDEKQEEIIKGLASSDVVVQPLTGNRHQDLRVYVIGKRIVASVLRTAKEGFKSNFSLGGEVSLYQLSKEESMLVQTIIDQFNFGLVGIDFIVGDQGELIFNEIEDVVGSRMLYQCSDINIVKEYLMYIKESVLEERVINSRIF